MKKFFFITIFCLLAGFSQMSAQLTIHSSGRAEIGIDPYIPGSLSPQYENWLDTVTVLKIFGN